MHRPRPWRRSSRGSADRGEPPRRVCLGATGSAGTIAAGDYLRAALPRLHGRRRPRRCSARRCSHNGFGAHRIEGIGDKHVPWIHNVRNTDVVAAIDDEELHAPAAPLQRAGRARDWLVAQGVDPELVGRLAAARHLGDLQPAGGDQDRALLRARRPTTSLLHLLSPTRWSSTGSRLAEEHAPSAAPTRERQAAVDLERCLLGAGDRPPARADLPGPQGAAQPQVLHLGRAAGARPSRSSTPCGRRRSGPICRPSSRRGTRRSSRSTERPGSGVRGQGSGKDRSHDERTGGAGGGAGGTSATSSRSCAS